MDEKMKLVYETLGRVQAVVEMLDKPELYRVSPETGLARIREIIAAYKLNASVIIDGGGSKLSEINEELNALPWEPPINGTRR